MKNIAVFLDRDGVINKRAKEHDYIKSWSEFEFLPNVAEVIRQLNKNFLVIVASNQGGISRGLMTINDLNNIHNKMQLKLKNENAVIDKIYFCPHYIDDNCNCRKPRPGLLLQAAEDLNIDLSKSYMAGDSLADIEAGKTAGCKTILLGTPLIKSAPNPDFATNNLLDILKIVLKI